MTLRTVRGVPAALALLALIAGCSSGRSSDTPAANTPAGDMAGMGGMSTRVTIPKGAIYTAADVRFMQGMIAHHAQAIFMSRLAAEVDKDVAGAKDGARVKTLASEIRRLAAASR